MSTTTVSGGYYSGSKEVHLVKGKGRGQSSGGFELLIRLVKVEEESECYGSGDDILGLSKHDCMRGGVSAL